MLGVKEVARRTSKAFSKDGVLTHFTIELYNGLAFRWFETEVEGMERGQEAMETA